MAFKFARPFLVHALELMLYPDPHAIDPNAFAWLVGVPAMLATARFCDKEFAQRGQTFRRFFFVWSPVIDAGLTILDNHYRGRPLFYLAPQTDQQATVGAVFRLMHVVAFLDWAYYKVCLLVR